MTPSHVGFIFPLVQCKFSCFVTRIVEIVVFCVLISCGVVSCRLQVDTNVSEEYAAFSCIVNIIVPNSTLGTVRMYILQIVKLRNQGQSAFYSTFPFHSSCWMGPGYVSSPFLQFWLATLLATSAHPCPDHFFIYLNPIPLTLKMDSTCSSKRQCKLT